MANSRGKQTSKQTVAAHFPERTATLLLSVLQEAVRRMVCEPVVSLLQLTRFSGVFLEDGRTISWPARRSGGGKGCGCNPQGPPKQRTEPKTEAGITRTVRWDLVRGGVHGPHR